MNRNSLQRAAFISMLLVTASAVAEGFVELPSEGFPIEGQAEAVSAYTLCNLTGEFGADEDGSIPPTFGPTGANNTCAIEKIPAGYKQIKNARRNISRTAIGRGGRLVKINVGSVTDRVWRNKEEGSCIYGAKVKLNNVDANPSAPGKQYFEVNDIVRGGFAARDKEAAYQYAGGADEVIYRIGLTFTSLVFEPEAASDAQPPVEDAAIHENWVDFTTDLNYRDDDGSSYRDSPWMLVKTSCSPEDSPALVDGVFRFRQMGQEDQEYAEIKVSGFAPGVLAESPIQ